MMTSLITKTLEIRKRKPLEDNIEWKYRHTRDTARQNTTVRQTVKRKKSYNDNVGVAGGVATQESSPESLAELQAKEMAAYRYVVGCGLLPGVII